MEKNFQKDILNSEKIITRFSRVSEYVSIETYPKYSSQMQRGVGVWPYPPSGDFFFHNLFSSWSRIFGFKNATTLSWQKHLFLGVLLQHSQNIAIFRINAFCKAFWQLWSRELKMNFAPFNLQKTPKQGIFQPSTN